MNATLPATECAAAQVRIRGFEPGDAARISALFQRHTPYQRDAAFWLWLNRTIPVRPSIIAVAEVDGEIAGHYAILPVELRLPDGRLVLAGQGVHAFVSPEHRQDVSIYQVTAQAYRLAKAAGLQFVYGFPNVNYRLVQEKIERWRSIALFKAWTKPASGRAPATARLGPADLTDDAQLHAAIALWEQTEQGDASIRVAGATRWWQVRYLQHPQHPYRFHWLLVCGERRGLVVSKIFAAKEETRAHLVDYVLAAGEAPGVLLAAFDELHTGRAERLVHWPVDAGFTAALQAAGYQPDGFETWFGLRALGSAPLDPQLLEASAWRLPMGFSDAF